MRRITLMLNEGRVAELQRLAARRGQTLSALVDELLAEGIGRTRASKRSALRLPTFDMGEPAVDIANRDQLPGLATQEYIFQRIERAKRILRRAGRGKPPVVGDEL